MKKLSEIYPNVFSELSPGEILENLGKVGMRKGQPPCLTEAPFRDFL